MFFKINSAWSALAAMLALVGLYLFLSRSNDFKVLAGAGTNTLVSIFGVLQGRGTTQVRK